MILLSAVFLIHYRRSKREIMHSRQSLIQTQETLKRRESQLKELQDSIGFSVGATRYEDAVDYVDSLLEKETLPGEKEKLKLLKNCLMTGNDNSMYIPQNLTQVDEDYIMKEFAGLNNSVNKRVQFGSRHVYSGPSTRHFKTIVRSASKHEDDRDSFSLAQECLTEFTKLEVSKQKRLFELLSFNSLKTWNFNIFDVAEVDESNTLLFVSWAVICSPRSQIAMAKELRQAGVAEASETEEFDGYDFYGKF